MSATTYDLHLAATTITPEAVRRLDQLGFQRDSFINLTFCHTGEYHATYRGPRALPCDDLWQELAAILHGDPTFSGYLEEEATGATMRQRIEGVGERSLRPLPRLLLEECGPTRHKSCDIHVGTNLDRSSPEALSCLDALEVAYVEKPTPEGTRRVYTATFDSLADGRAVYSVLRDYLVRLPGYVGKIKLEVIRRWIRLPDDAATLPIASRNASAAWLQAMESLPLGSRPASRASGAA